MEIDEYLPALRRTTPGSPRRRPRPCSPTAGRRGCRAARTGRWPTSSGTWPRCSASGPGSCGPGPGPVGLRRSRSATRTTSCSATRPPQSAELEAALAGADPAERVWTWAPQQDVAFVLRRQVQEATVHTVDVEQVLGDVRPVPTDVGLDGLDEWLEVMVPGALPDGPPARRAPRRPPRRRRRRRADPLRGLPAVPDRDAHRHGRRPAARRLAAGAAGGAHRRRRRRCRPPR